MKTLFLGLTFSFLTLATYAQEQTVKIYQINSDKSKAAQDSIIKPPFKLQVDGTNAFYRQTVKADTVVESLIYIKAVEFFAGKNFQQTYGDQEEGKLIFATTQDLNVTEVAVGDENKAVRPYTVQFSIALDMKNRRYRYTISNVVFFEATEIGNKRLTLYDVYLKATTDGQSRYILKDNKELIASFERYIGSLTDDLQTAVKRKLAVYDTSF